MVDICLCATEDCPHYNECVRGGLVKKCGIYTVSNLGQVCNEEVGYICWIKGDKHD